MNIIDEIRLQVEPVYEQAVAEAGVIRQTAYNTKLAELMPSRDERLQTHDPALALIHFLGVKAFEPLVMHRFDIFTAELQTRQTEGLTPLLLIARMDPQRAAERHTSLALLPSSPLLFESSVTVGDDCVNRTFGLVAETATIEADFERRPQSGEAPSPTAPQSVVTDTLTLRHYNEERVKEVRDDINNYNDEIVDRTSADRSSYLGWQAIAEQRLAGHWLWIRHQQYPHLESRVQDGTLQITYFKTLVNALGIQATARREIREAEETLYHPYNHLSLAGTTL